MLLLAWALVVFFAIVSMVLLYLWFRRKRTHDYSHSLSDAAPVRNLSRINSSKSKSDLKHNVSSHVDALRESLPYADSTVLFTEDNDDRTVMFSHDSEVLQDADPLDFYPYLKVVAGPNTGTAYPLPFDRSSIGRSDSNDIVLADETASRTHFEIVFRNSGFMLRDYGSTNGTYCNGKRIEQTVLEFSDKIDAAESQMIFSFKGFDLMEQDKKAAIEAFENCLSIEPEFLLVIKNLAFLLERDLKRKGEAELLWDKVSRLNNVV